MRDILQVIYDQHDVECNQKYNKTLPYSFHLKAVVAQCDKYITLVREENRSLVKIGAAGHDLIEDAGMTYNDVTDMLKGWGYTLSQSIIVADIIYSCTEEKGKDRPSRHSQKFFNELKENRLAVFVKLCDILANVTFSLLTNSSMTSKYRSEFPKLEKELYIEGEYDPIWKDLEKLLRL